MTETQKELCRRFDTQHEPPEPFQKLGISRGALRGDLPLNGLRHPAETSTSGWYIWAEEQFSQAPDFFAPVHVNHIPEVCPAVLRYLALPPGWRFLIANSYEDVWFDEALLTLHGA